MFSVYILKSVTVSRYYVGVTTSVAERLENHNRGSTRSTKPYRPWVLVHVETYNSRAEAVQREAIIKSYKGGNAFKRLIGVQLPGEVA
jgi:putative endonuclease